MTRYYEENALIEFVKQHTPTINGETTMECVERAIREAPTADVVPKSEVASGVLTTDNPTLADVIKHYQKVYAREIFEEIDQYICGDEIGSNITVKCEENRGFIIAMRIAKKITELKKKYTESEGKG